MPSSLGLIGDLDDVDLIEDVEAAFGLRFFDHEIERCSTVGHLFALVENRLAGRIANGRCATAMCFYRLRRALRSRSTIELRPATPISELTRLSVRDLHRIIEFECKLRPPPEEMSYWGAAVFLLGCILPLGAMAIGQPWWIALVLVIAAFSLLRSTPIRLPADVETLGDLVRLLASRNIGALAARGARLGSAEAWAAFKDILCSHSSLPRDEIARDTLILAPKAAA